MIRLTITLIVAIYIVLIVIPEPDHGTEEDDGGETGQNWIVALITDAEETASTPRTAAPADRVVRGNPLERLEETDDGFVLETADGEVLEIAAVIDPSAVYAQETAEVQPAASVSVAETPVVQDAVLVAAPDPTADLGPDAAADAAPDATPVVEVALVANEAQEAPVEPATPLWRVAGDRVNFRAAPTTDAAILAALVRGDEVEYLGAAPDDWAHLRIVSTGLEGYMAAQFLEPVN